MENRYLAFWAKTPIPIFVAYTDLDDFASSRKPHKISYYQLNWIAVVHLTDRRVKGEEHNDSDSIVCLEEVEYITHNINSTLF